MAAVTMEEIEQKIDEKLKEACLPGGLVHALQKDVKDNETGNKKYGVAGIMSMEGDKMQPEKFESEAKTGILFRHWNEEMKSYLKIIDEGMMILLNVAEIDLDKKADDKTLKDYLELQNASAIKDKYYKKYLEKFDDIDKMYYKIRDEKDGKFWIESCLVPLHTVTWYYLLPL